MQLEVLLFAAAKEAADESSIVVEVPESPTAADVIAAIGERLPELAGLLPSCRLAVDCGYVTPQSVLDGDLHEVALIPPVSGG